MRHLIAIACIAGVMMLMPPAGAQVVGFNYEPAMSAPKAQVAPATQSIWQVRKYSALEILHRSQNGFGWLDGVRCEVMTARRGPGEQVDTLNTNRASSWLYVENGVLRKRGCGNRVLWINVYWEGKLQHPCPAPCPQPQYVPCQPQPAPCPPPAPCYQRVIGLAPGGPGVIQINRAVVSYHDTPGIFGALMYPLGQALRRPSSVNVSQVGGGAKVGDIINKNANTNVNANSQNTAVNVGDGSATGSSGAAGTGSSNAGGK